MGTRKNSYPETFWKLDSNWSLQIYGSLTYETEEPGVHVKYIMWNITNLSGGNSYM